MIGICASVERARWTYWDEEAAVLSMNYVRQVHEAGGIALVLAPDPHPEELLRLLDGLLLTGGADIGDAPERDAFELAIAAAALEADVPVLGVCRGMQVMNVARGGTLIAAPARQGRPRGPPADPGLVRRPRRPARRGVAGAAGRARAACTRPSRTTTRASTRSGEGLEITGWATVDDLPEAIEDPSKRFALGVQWHPEADAASPVIAALVEAAR